MILLCYCRLGYSYDHHCYTREYLPIKQTIKSSLSKLIFLPCRHLLTDTRSKVNTDNVASITAASVRAIHIVTILFTSVYFFQALIDILRQSQKLANLGTY